MLCFIPGEEKDFLVRIEDGEEKGAKMKEFHSVRSRPGTIAAITDLKEEGWMFVNFIAMILYYRLYNEPVGRDLLSKYSPKDVLEHLARVQKLKTGDECVTTEIPKAKRIYSG